MKYIKPIFILCFLLVVQSSSTQEHKVYKEINTQIWSNFIKAFETLDYELFDYLHSQNLIRINGDNKSIRKREVYLNAYKKRWGNGDINQTISFRFIERICNNKKASERGIYKLTRNPNTTNEKSYYGKFHVILIKEDTWKIMMDYDSSENNSIDENSYTEAYTIDEFDKF